MKTVLTFDVAKVDDLRIQLYRDGFKEGRQFRIGMGDKPHQMTLKAPDIDVLWIEQSAKKVLG
jgi:hypothetical protein